MIIVVHSLSQIDSSSFIVFLLLSLLCAALQNESLSNHAKIAVIGVFGDMALALREHFEPFVNVALLVFAVRLLSPVVVVRFLTPFSSPECGTADGTASATDGGRSR